MRNCNISKSRYSEYFGPYLTVKGVLKLVCIKEPKEQEITYQVTHTSHVQGHTYHGLEDVLHAFDQLLVDLDGQVADHLSVLCEVEVGQTVLVLPRRVVLHELLRQAQKTMC